MKCNEPTVKNKGTHYYWWCLLCFDESAKNANCYFNMGFNS